MKSSRQLLRRDRYPWLAGLPLLLVATPTMEHHPFAMPDGAQLSVWQGLISGLGHPLLGPDHFLFLLAMGLVGLGGQNWSTVW